MWSTIGRYAGACAQAIRQLSGDLATKTIYHSVIISVRHYALTPSGPQADRINKLRGTEIVYLDHDSCFRLRWKIWRSILVWYPSRKNEA